MWKPNQLLHDEAVEALRQGGLSEMEIEYLGWLSYNAAAINRSRNPVKAAHTILAKEVTDKLVDKFMAKKQESIAPKDAPDHDAVSRKLAKFERWVKEVEAESKPYRPSRQDLEDCDAS